MKIILVFKKIYLKTYVKNNDTNCKRKQLTRPQPSNFGKRKRSMRKSKKSKKKSKKNIRRKRSKKY